jgi:hypothetical protein
MIAVRPNGAEMESQDIRAILLELKITIDSELNAPE